MCPVPGVGSAVRFVPHEFFVNAGKGKIRKGDILVVKDGATTGKTAFVGDDFPFTEAMVNEHTFILRTKPTLLPKLAFFCLHSEMAAECFVAAREHGMIGGLTQSFPEDIKIPIPPLEEQRRLVNRIESMTGRLEVARQIRIDVLADMRAALAATLASIFEGDEDWIETTLVEVCTMKTGKTPPTKQSEYFGGDVPFVCPADVGNSLRITQAERTLTRLAITVRKANLFPCGTVLLVGIGSTVGKVGIAAADVCTNQQITGLTFSSRVDPEYAAWFLLSQRKEIVHAAADNGVPIINQNGIGKLAIRFPEDVNDQRRIVARLDALAEKQTELRRLQAETAAELTAFTPALLAKAFRGEL